MLEQVLKQLSGPNSKLLSKLLRMGKILFIWKIKKLFIFFDLTMRYILLQPLT